MTYLLRLTFHMYSRMHREGPKDVLIQKIVTANTHQIVTNPPEFLYPRTSPPADLHLIAHRVHSTLMLIHLNITLQGETLNKFHFLLPATRGFHPVHGRLSPRSQSLSHWQCYRIYSLKYSRLSRRRNTNKAQTLLLVCPKRIFRKFSSQARLRWCLVRKLGQRQHF